MKIDIKNDIKVKIKLMNGEALSAIATLTFFDSIEIRGFTIRPTKFKANKGNFFLSPPASRTSKGTWIKLFFTNDKGLWEEIQKFVLEEFDIQHTEEHLSSTELPL